MGIIYGDIRNLIQEFKPIARDAAVLTLGRLSVYLHRTEIARLRKLFADDQEALSYFESYEWGEYSERLFRALFKCKTIDSLDFSDYQGATIRHDLQQPVPVELQSRYDLVFDGGTLEHVFNLPAGLANVIRLARTGGLVYLNSPSNNLSGHGFYQFSPELMFRVFSPDNGMKLILNRIGIACYPSIEKSVCHRVYEVTDPDQVQSRVGLLSSRPAYMMVMARKTAEIEPFSQPVLQSDYSRQWQGAASVRPRRAMARRLLARLPFALRMLIIGWRERWRYSLANTRFYRRVW